MNLGYDESEIEDIIRYAVGHGTLENAPGVDHAALKAKGFTTATIQALESALASAFDIRFAFNKWTLGEDFCISVLGITKAQLDRSEEHTSELPSLMRLSYAVFCFKKKNIITNKCQD